MRSSKLLALSVSCFLVCPTGWAEPVDPPHFLEVLVRVHDGTLSALHATRRSGRLPARRTANLSVRSWVVYAQDTRSRILYSMVLPDPQQIYADGLIREGHTAQLTGGLVLTPDALTVVRLPDDPRIVTLRIARVTQLPPPQRRDATAQEQHSSPHVEASIQGAQLEPLALLRLPPIVDGSAAGSAFDTETLIDHGNPANRVDLVILGDGYTAAEQAKLRDDAMAVLDHLFGEPPFQDYANYVNAHLVKVISQESGVDHPNPKHPEQSVFRDTALGIKYYYADVSQCVYSETPEQVTEAAALAPAPHDVILVLVNDHDFGGCTGAFAVAAMSDDQLGPAGMAHEVGHALGRLGDEYTSETPDGDVRYEGGEPSFANLTIQTRWQDVKWNRWIPFGIGLPIPASIVVFPAGLYEGGSGYQYGIFRPTVTSKMRWVQEPWEAVNAEQLVNAIYGIVKPIDQATPPDPLVTLAPGVQTFRVVPMERCCNELQVTWFVDGDKVLEGSLTLMLNRRDFSSGTHSVQARVTDETDAVRTSAVKTRLTDTVQWTVQVPVLQPPRLTLPEVEPVNEGERLTFVVAATDGDGGLLELGVSGLPEGARFDQVLRSEAGRIEQLFEWTPSGQQAGTYPVHFTATDDDQLTDSPPPLMLTVQQVNQPPQLAPIEMPSGFEGIPFIVSFAAHDDDDDPLTYRLNPLPMGAAFNPEEGRLHWTPAADQSGSYPMTIAVSDGALEDRHPFVLTIVERSLAVSGTVSDAQGRPVEGVEIRVHHYRQPLQDMDGERLIGRTDTQGRFLVGPLEEARRVRTSVTLYRTTGRRKMLTLKVIPHKSNTQFLVLPMGRLEYTVIFDPAAPQDIRDIRFVVLPPDFWAVILQAAARAVPSSLSRIIWQLTPPALPPQ